MITAEIIPAGSRVKVAVTLSERGTTIAAFDRFIRNMDVKQIDRELMLEVAGALEALVTDWERSSALF